MNPASSPIPPRSYLLEFTLLGALILGILYFAGYRALSHRAEALDRPLRQAWENFATTNQSSEATAGLSLDQLPGTLETLQLAAGDLAEIRGRAAERVRLPAAWWEQIRAPFQILEYENERTRLAESLVALARSRKIALEAGVTNGLPVRTPDTIEPALLWARLGFARELLLSALHCQVSAVRELAQLPPVSHRSRVDGRRLYEELPMRVEVVGALDAVNRWLTSLPLTGAELEPVGLANVLTNKPALFLSHLRARKSAPDHPAEVRAEVVVSGFVPLEAARETPALATELP